MYWFRFPARWCLKSPASWLFAKLFVQMQIKENIKALHWPLWGEFPHKGQVTRKMFPFDDIIMDCVSTMLFKCLDYKPVFPMEVLLFCNNPAKHSSTLWINIHFRSHHQIEFHCGSLSSMVYQLQETAAIQNAHVGLTISSSVEAGFVRIQIKYRLQVTGI